MKKFFAPLIIFFVGLFMVFIYEPITTYASNIDDYWFGLNQLVKTNVLFVIIGLIICIFLVLIIYFLNKKWLYNLFLLIISSVLIICYIHGNYLTKSLPILDGAAISWGKYTTQNIISIIIVLIVLTLNFIVLRKYKKNYSKILMYVSLAIFFMLSSSLVVTLISNDEIYKFKGSYTPTNKDINTLSENKNFLIFVIDMADSKTFDKNLEFLDKKDLLKDFTYYPDTLSAYSYTRESIPYILLGKWFEGNEPMTNYYNRAFKDTKLISLLKDNNYTINMYEPDIKLVTEKINFNNIILYNYTFSKMIFLRQEMKYILYKYLPFPLKRFSRAETIDYELCKSTSDNNIYYEQNNKVYDTLDEIKTQKNNYFHFLHIEGDHYPWDIDKDFKPKSPATYDDKLASSITVMEKYLERIKKSGQYDNSAIVILADHGHNYDDYASSIGRQNPILYIKGFDEIHDEMQISDKRVSFIDLNDSIYEDLLNGKKSSELLTDVTNDRIRYFMWYEKYDYIYEQSLDGFAWETEKLENTGKVYER